MDLQNEVKRIVPNHSKDPAEYSYGDTDEACEMVKSGQVKTWDWYRCDAFHLGFTTIPHIWTYGRDTYWAKLSMVQSIRERKWQLVRLGQVEPKQEFRHEIRSRQIFISSQLVQDHQFVIGVDLIVAMYDLPPLYDYSWYIKDI